MDALAHAGIVMWDDCAFLPDALVGKSLCRMLAGLTLKHRLSDAPRLKKKKRASVRLRMLRVRASVCSCMFMSSVMQVG